MPSSRFEPNAATAGWMTLPKSLAGKQPLVGEIDDNKEYRVIETVGISSPGEMGHAVAKVLMDRGMPVIACLVGRGERSRQRADVAGIEAVSHPRRGRAAGRPLSVDPTAGARRCNGVSDRRHR